MSDTGAVPRAALAGVIERQLSTNAKADVTALSATTDFPETRNDDFIQTPSITNVTSRYRKPHEQVFP